MAEEQDVQQEQAQAPAFNREELDAMIRAGVRESMLGAAREATQQAQQRQQQQVPQQEENPFKQWVDPLVQPGLQQANIRTLMAEDKVDFYSSDQWQRDIRQHLVGETDEEQSKELADIRQEIEQTAEGFAQQGRPIVRRDLADYVIGKRIRAQAAKYEAAVNKRMTARQNAEIAKAKKSVDMAGAVMDFDPRSVHTMPLDKVVEQYGDFQF